ALFNRIAEWFKNRPKKEKTKKTSPPKKEAEPIIESPAEEETVEKRTQKKRKSRFPKKTEEPEPDTAQLLEEAEQYEEPEVYDSEILMEEYEDTPTADKQTQADHDLQIEEEAVEKKELEYDTPDDD